MGSCRAAGKETKKQSSKGISDKEQRIEVHGRQHQKRGQNIGCAQTMARYFTATAEMARGLGISPSFATDAMQKVNDVLEGKRCHPG